ncbi:MAG: DUF5131 family protein [Burkholderiales bacterium]
MSALTSIEWTDVVWNPVTGCSKVSEGCRNCYAEAVAHRFWGARKFTDVQCHADRLAQPLHWKKPRRIFVNSMSDLFHEAVPDEFIDRIFAVMALTSHHTYQILTKRPSRMQDYAAQLLNEGDRWSRFGDAVGPLIGNQAYELAGERPWPLPNVWLGVSIEDPVTADERIPILLRTPAAVRFVSIEPILGIVDIRRYLGEAGRTGISCAGGTRMVSGQGRRHDLANDQIYRRRDTELRAYIEQLEAQLSRRGACYPTQGRRMGRTDPDAEGGRR